MPISHEDIGFWSLEILAIFRFQDSQCSAAICCKGLTEPSCRRQAII